MFDLPEAQLWLKESENRMFGDDGHTASEKLVEDLYALGCKKIYVIAKGGQAASCSSSCPRTRPSARGPRHPREAHGDPPLKDKGQKYIIFEWVVGGSL